MRMVNVICHHCLATSDADVLSYWYRVMVPSPDLLDGVVDGVERRQEPFARDDRVAEAVLNFDIETRRREDAVDQLLQLGAVDVVELVRGDDLDVGPSETSVPDARLRCESPPSRW